MVVHELQVQRVVLFSKLLVLNRELLLQLLSTTISFDPGLKIQFVVPVLLIFPSMRLENFKEDDSFVFQQKVKKLFSTK